MIIIKTALLVTFDFSQRGKSGTGLAAASLVSACRHHKNYNERFTIEHLSVFMSDNRSRLLSIESVFTEICNKINLATLDSLALACYVWSSKFIEPLIKRCRDNGFKGKVILGGYQINKENCRQLYPSGNFYIVGYGEAALPLAILDDTSITSQILDIPVNLQDFPSPYIDGSLPLVDGQNMVHWETRRGCVFKCNFCAHRDLKSNKVHLFSMDKIKQELRLFKKLHINKINVLDPIFNLEPNHLQILQYAIDIGLTSLLSFQVRFEKINDEFLCLCSQLNVHLEFGLQTTDKKESRIIKRGNNLKKACKSITLLHKWQQSFEVSLIYGLPSQTLASFQTSINFLTERKVSIIKAFPLMLLEGTDLAKARTDHQIVEDVIDTSGIPHVVACESFTREEWGQMHTLACSLNASKEAA